MTADNLQKYVALLEKEQNMLTRLSNLVLIPYFRLKIKQKLWKIGVEIDSKNNYINAYKHHHAQQ